VWPAASQLWHARAANNILSPVGVIQPSGIAVVLAQIEHRFCEAFNVIIGQGNLIGRSPDANTNAFTWGRRLANVVLRYGYRFRLSLKVNSDAILLHNPQDKVLLDDIAIPLERRNGFFSKQNADLAA
jgi:hypothetical protein